MLLHLGPFHFSFGPRKSDLQTLTAMNRVASETWAEGVEARRKTGSKSIGTARGVCVIEIVDGTCRDVVD